MTHTHLSHGSPTYHAAGEHQHVHLVCRECGAFDEIDPELLRPLADQLATERGSGWTSGTWHSSASAAAARTGTDMIDIAGAVAVEASTRPAVTSRTRHARPGAGVAAHYGDPLREQRTLGTEVGLVDRSHRGDHRGHRAGAGRLAAHPHHAST